MLMPEVCMARPLEDAEADRDALHRLVDELPADERRAARRYLEYLRSHGDPLLSRMLEADFEDEAISDDEERAAREGWDAYRRGEGKPLRQIREELARE
jgi:hypothetical protein